MRAPALASSAADDARRAHAASLVRRGRPFSLIRAEAAHWTVPGGGSVERFVGRGVLLDLVRTPVTGENRLRAVAEAQGATSAVRRGDIVLVRGGDDPLDLACADWLARCGVLAVAVDSPLPPPAAAPLPPPAAAPLPPPAASLSLGHGFVLDELADDCASDGVYEFLLVAVPLALHGRPVHPTALK